MVQLDAAKDLAALFNPPQQERYSGFRYGQGTVLTWDPATFENTVSFRSLTLTNLPILGKIDGLSLKAGDVVGLMGWAPNGGFGAWWILGELGTPPLSEPVAVEGGANIIINDGGNIVINDGGNLEVNNGGDIVVDGGGQVLIDGVSRSLQLESGGIFFLNGNDDIIGELRAIGSTSGEMFMAADDGMRIVGAIGTVDVLTLATEQSGGGALFHTNFGEDRSILGHDTISTGTPDVDMLANGLVRRITSSRRYKTDIQDFVINPRTTLDLKPRIWRDKKAVDKDPDDQQWGIGYIAEELDDIGLGAFVRYDHEGRPNGIKYDRLTIPLLELCKEQQRRLDALETRVAAIDGNIAEHGEPTESTVLPKWCDSPPQQVTPPEEMEKMRRPQPRERARRLTRDDVKKTENAKGGTV